MDGEADDRAGPRRRRPWAEDDYDDYDFGAAPLRSGVVTMVGVLGIVWGALVLMGSLIFILVAFIAMAEGRGRDREIAVIILSVSMVALVVGGLYVTGGIGLLGRRNWARVLTLILGAVNILAAAASGLGMTASFRTGEPRVALVLFSCMSIFLNLGYGLLVYLTLLRAEIAREFTL